MFGDAVSAAPSPSPTTTSIDVKPKPMPSMCGIVRRNPKFTPDASSIMLFGPGVIEVANAKTDSASRASPVIGARPGRAELESCRSRQNDPIPLEDATDGRARGNAAGVRRPLGKSAAMS